MCLAIPMKLKKITGARGLVESGGIKKEIHLGLLKNAKIGDYLLIHAGFAIQIIDKKEARKTLAVFEEIEESEWGLNY